MNYETNFIMRLIFICGYCNKQFNTRAKCLDCEHHCLGILTVEKLKTIWPEPSIRNAGQLDKFSKIVTEVTD